MLFCLPGNEGKFQDQRHTTYHSEQEPQRGRELQTADRNDKGLIISRSTSRFKPLLSVALGWVTVKMSITIFKKNPFALLYI